MARVSNAESGRGYTHKVEIDLDDYKEVTGNADIEVTLLGGTEMKFVKGIHIIPDALIDADEDISIAVGDATDPDGYLEAEPVNDKTTRGLLQLTMGAYFNDGTTSNTVNWHPSTEPITATLSLASGDWSSNNGKSICVLLNVIESI